MSGTAAPGTGANFNNFDASTTFTPLIDNSGQVAFVGNITGAGTIAANDSAIFSEGGGRGLLLIAREGSSAIGTEAFYAHISGSDLSFNRNGELAFYNPLTIDVGIGGMIFSGNQGIFSEGGSGVELVVRGRDEAPGIGVGVNFDGLSSTLRFNDNGQVAFRPSFTGPGIATENNNGFFIVGNGTGPTLIARVGDPAPGAGMGVDFRFIFSNRFEFNNNGQVAFESELIGTGVTNANRGAIFSQSGGGLAPVVRMGNPAPGTGTGVTFRSFGNFLQNDNAKIAFTASLTGTEVTTANDGALYSDASGSGLTLIAREGDPVPGLGTGVHYSFFGADPLVIDNNGHTIFRSSLDGTEVTDENNAALFRETSGSGISLIARKGDPAPGAGAGVNFKSGFFNLAYNNNGQVAFSNRTTDNKFGIWAEDLVGELQLIALEGELLDVSDNPLTPDLREISDLSFRSDRYVTDGGFNDLGQLAFLATFTDGTSGIFVSSALIPEPSTAVLALLSLSALLGFSRKR